MKNRKTNQCRLWAFTAKLTLIVAVGSSDAFAQSCSITWLGSVSGSPGQSISLTGGISTTFSSPVIFSAKPSGNFALGNPQYYAKGIVLLNNGFNTFGPNSPSAFSGIIPITAKVGNTVVVKTSLVNALGQAICSASFSVLVVGIGVVEAPSWESQGGDIAIGDFNGNGKSDLVLMVVDNPSGVNNIRYKIGWDVAPDGKVAAWTSHKQLNGILGTESQGGGAAIADLNLNGKPDLVLMLLDHPGGMNNRFRYFVGWDVKPTGDASSWSGPIAVEAPGWDAQGAALAFTDLDKNGKVEMVLMAINKASGPSAFRWQIGWNVDTTGKTSSWTLGLQAPGLGWICQGGGMAFGDINGNGVPEIVLMSIDNPAGPNTIRFAIGWDVGTSGKPTSWSPNYQRGGVGWETQGGGVAFAKIDGNPKPDLVFLAIDHPAGGNVLRFQLALNLSTNGTPTQWVP